jgi:hypothetical protein
LLHAQSISGSENVCPLRQDQQSQPFPYTYSLTGLPQGIVIDKIIWYVEDLGLDGNINGVIGFNNGTTSYNSGTNTSVDIVWGTAKAGFDVQMDAIIYDHNNNATSVPVKIVSIRGIGNGSISGKKNPTKCCTEEITYTVTGVGVWANEFDWINIPAGWNVNGAIDQPSLKVDPDKQTGGQLTCRVRMSCSDPSYYKDVTVNITRPDANIQFVQFDLAAGGYNQDDGICAKREYTYKINEVCGASHYTWNFPPSWQQNGAQIGPGSGQGILPHVFYQSDPNLNEVTIKTSNAPLDGSVTVTAHFAGCASVTSDPLSVKVLKNPPSAVNFINTANEYFHCGEWKFCNVGELEVTNPPASFVESYTWNITSPWYFQTPTGAVQTLTKPFSLPK